MERPRFDVDSIRDRFPALARSQDGRPCVFADAPGGTQVPSSVVEAMAGYLRSHNANVGGAFPPSRETDEVIASARAAAADLLGAEPAEVVFGPNMTTLAFGMSHALAGTLGPGDEVVVTRLDHDANIAPWIAAAEDAGATVRWVDVHPENCTLDLEGLDGVLGPRTRLVAFTLASNAVGTVTPAREVISRVHAAGALAVADGVHYAQHRLMDAAALGADVLFCSPYKVFGPHLGIMVGRGGILERLRPYKVRPASDVPPMRWETGTQNHEALAGLAAAVDYLAGLGRDHGGDAPSRRGAVVAAMEAIRAHEATLSVRFLEGIREISDLQLYGLADRGRAGERTPTFAVRLGDLPPRALAEELGRRGVFVWDGNYYALALMERLGLQGSGGAVRIGFCHYNSAAEVDRILEELSSVTAASARTV